MADVTPKEGETTAPPAKKPFEFKKSALSAKADQMWNKSKLGFGTSVTSHIKLEKKTLDDVLGKMVAEKKEKEEMQQKPKFIFGSKIADRVIQDGSAKVVSEKTDEEAPKKAEDLFKSAALQKSDTAPADAASFRAEAVAAAEKLKEQEKQHASTSLVTVTTGEEEDEVVFQNACKLHSYDKDRKMWVEKGLSQIRINKRMQDGEKHHRIVARTTGNHKVVINSKIFSNMLLERVDQKRIKLSAMGPDSPHMQIFLVTIGFSKTDFTVDQFYETLRSVLNMEKELDTASRKRKADESSSQESSEKKEKQSNFAAYDVVTTEKEVAEEKTAANSKSDEKPAGESEETE